MFSQLTFVRAFAVFRRTLLMNNIRKTMQASIHASALLHRPEPLEPVVDVDMDNEMYDDIVGDHASSAPLAPVDIDGFADDEEVKQGTVDMDDVDKPVFEYPPVPKERTGVYELKGLKIVMPPKMMENPGTYRWRVDPDDQTSASDDMRICRFEPAEKE